MGCHTWFYDKIKDSNADVIFCIVEDLSNQLKGISSQNADSSNGITSEYLEDLSLTIQDLIRSVSSGDTISLIYSIDFLSTDGECFSHKGIPKPEYYVRRTNSFYHKVLWDSGFRLSNYPCIRIWSHQDFVDFVKDESNQEKFKINADFADLLDIASFFINNPEGFIEFG